MKVSASMITYNHEKYIAQAIDSVLMQKVNFDYEIVIGEDCSTDKTRDIVMDYQKRYPDKIRLVLPEKNLGLGGKKIFVQTLQACQGEYIALLDGDDYWTSPDKLQEQADFLDNHPDCAICFHNVTKFYDDGSQQLQNNPVTQKEISTLEDIVKWDFIATCSTMYRRGLFNEFPDWFYSVLSGDWALHILNAQHGKIGYINKNMAVYRIHSGGLWSQLSYTQRSEEIVKFYDTANAHLNYKYSKIISTMKGSEYYKLAVACEKDGDLAVAKKYATQCMKCWFDRPVIKAIPIVELLKMWLRLSGIAPMTQRSHNIIKGG